MYRCWGYLWLKLCAMSSEIPPPMVVRFWESYYERPSCTSAQLWRSPSTASIVGGQVHFVTPTIHLSSNLHPFLIHTISTSPRWVFCLEPPIHDFFFGSSRHLAAAFQISEARLVRKTETFGTRPCRRIIAQNVKVSPSIFAGAFVETQYIKHTKKQRRCCPNSEG